MSAEMQKRAEDCIERITSSPHLVSIGTYRGIDVEATSDDTSLTFCHNLGMTPPSKDDAEALLDGLARYFEELRGSSSDFASFAATRIFRAELFVFSGQMDFRVATREGTVTTWYVSLD